MTGRVLVLGSLNVDSTSYVEEFPAPGETVASRGFAVALGGKGTNQAVAAHLAGASVDLVARVGTDAAGTFALDTVREFGVAVDAIEVVTDAATGVAQITVAASGENTVIVSAGANALVTPEVVDAHRWDIAAADIALTQGELPVDAVERLAALCAEVGTRFVLNLAPPVGISDAALAVCDPLVVNEHEAAALGIRPTSTHAGGPDAAGPKTAGPDAADLHDDSLDAWEAAAVATAGARCRSVVITLGSRGAVAAESEGSIRWAAPRVTAVDSTGAGDCFTGTLAAFLSEERSLAASVGLAVAAGALSVTARGTVASYATRADLLAFAGRAGLA